MLLTKPIYFSLLGLGGVEGSVALLKRFDRRTNFHESGGLFLEGNPWVMPPEAVVEEGLDAVDNYLTEVRTANEAGAQVATVKLLKVVLVGSSQAGKTRCLSSTNYRNRCFRTNFSIERGPASICLTDPVHHGRHQCRGPLFNGGHSSRRSQTQF